MSALDRYLRGLDEANSSFESFDTPMAVKGGAVIQKNLLQPAAQFTIRVTRNTADIAGVLPVAIFGWNKFFSQYIQRLSDSNQLPANTSYDGLLGGIVSPTAPNTGNASIIRFSYTDTTPNTDLLDVAADENPYTEILSATGFTPMRISKIRMSLSSSTAVNQFNQGIKIVRSSTFGKVEDQTIVPATQKSPMQFQDGIVDLIDYPIVVDAQTFMIVPIIAEAALTVAFSFEVQAFNRPLQA